MNTNKIARSVIAGLALILAVIAPISEALAANGQWDNQLDYGSGMVAAGNSSLGTVSSLSVSKAAFNAWSDNNIYWSDAYFIYKVAGQDKNPAFSDVGLPNTGGGGNNAYFGWNTTQNINLLTGLTYRGAYDFSYYYQAKDNNGSFNSQTWTQQFTITNGNYYASWDSGTGTQSQFNGGEATLSGDRTLMKVGAGQINLNGNNSYTGATTVSAGALEVQHNSALGTTDGSTTVNDGAQLRFYTGGAGLTVAETIGISGTGSGGAILSTGGNNVLTGTITLAANSRIGADTTGAAGSLSVSNVSGGSNVLFIGANGANIEIKGALSGAGNTQDATTTSLYKDGANALMLSGNNSYSGDTRVSAGSLTVASGGNLGDGTSDLYIAKDASVAINTSATVSSIREWGTTNGGTASIGSGATLSVGGNAYEAYQNSISGAGALSKSGTGTLGLYGTQGYTGKTTVSAGLLKLQNDIVSFASTNVEVSGGTFQTQSANVLDDSTAVTVNGGTFSVGGSDTIGALSGGGGTVDVTTGTLTTSFNAVTNSYSGAITGTGAFAKAGSGTLTLSGNNTKSGANTVSGGKLVVNGQLNGTTTVSSGATLAGSGSVGATILNSGATISPGNSPGTMSLTNGLVMNPGADYNWQIYNATGTAGASNGWDLLAVSGSAWDISNLTVGSFDINLWSLSSVSPSDVNGSAINFNNASSYSWEILTYASLTGTFNTNLFNINVAANNGTTGFANTLNNGTFSLALDTTNNALRLLFTPDPNPGPSPVPEPGTWAAAAMLAGAAGYARWRRRKDVRPEV